MIKLSDKKKEQLKLDILNERFNTNKYEKTLTISDTCKHIGINYRTFMRIANGGDISDNIYSKICVWLKKDPLTYLQISENGILNQLEINLLSKCIENHKRTKYDKEALLKLIENAEHSDVEVIKDAIEKEFMYNDLFDDDLCKATRWSLINISTKLGLGRLFVDYLRNYYSAIYSVT